MGTDLLISQFFLSIHPGAIDGDWLIKVFCVIAMPFDQPNTQCTSIYTSWIEDEPYAAFYCPANYWEPSRGHEKWATIKKTVARRRWENWF